MMNSKGKMKHTKKRVRILAAAALTAVLLGGQGYSALAQDSQAESEIQSLIPENVTIESPVSLGEIALPDNEYGTLTWADPSYVPSERVESCGVILTPADGADLSWMSGWDAQAGVWKGSITVVVSSLEESAGDAQEAPGDADQEETSGKDETQSGDSGAVSEAADADHNAVSEDDTADLSSEESGAGETLSEEDGSAADSAEEGAADENGDPAGESAAGDAENPAGDDGMEEKGDVPKDGSAAESGESSGDGSAGENGDASEDVSAGENGDASGDESADGTGESAGDVPAGENGGSAGDLSPEEGEAPQEDEEDAGSSSEPSAGENTGDQDENQPGSSSGEEESGTPAEPDNIFDRTEVYTDNRSVSAEEDLTEEQQIQRAAENHTCDGIYVSGVDLPWYVQFRATSGEGYEFSNENGAALFRSYEFRLWDLKSQTEYVIPDGEYISVTVPVKEGYDYTVEHILSNGAVETIIPSVEGSTLVFSTHSFSPFGIAGSQSVVGGEVSDKNYPEKTPTPTPTAVPTKKPAPTKKPSPTAAPGSTGSGNSGSSVSKDTSGYDYSNRQDTNDSGSNDADSGTSSGKENESKTSRAVATGDETQIYPLLVMMLAGILAAAGAAAAGKRKAR